VRVLGLVESGLVGLFFRGSVTPFTALAPALRGPAFDAWKTSSIALLRGAHHALRRLLLASYYTPLTEAKETGYGGPPFTKPDLGPLVENQPISPRAAVPPPVAPTTTSDAGVADAGTP
jgi:hypothetical protein